MLPLENKIHNLLIERKFTLALAESLTGGSLAYSFVKIPGCSAYLMGSIVAYSNLAKKELLSVSAKTLESFGEVSEEAAYEMAEGALQKFHSDFSLSVTGIAGPTGATEKKPVGMVCFALASKKKKTLAWTAFFEGEREVIIKKTLQEALERLFERLLSCSLGPSGPS